MTDSQTSTALHGAARISVVVTVQNDAPGLERCLAGIERQGTLLEVIVIDRGSIDNSMAAATRWGARVVEAGSISTAEARNIGLRRCSGDATLFLDTKSIPCPGWARALAGPIVDGKTLVTKGAFRTRQTATTARLEQLLHERRWSHQEGRLSFLDDYCIGVHRAEFLEMGGFSEDAAGVAIEDQRTSRRICDSGRALFVPQAVIERQYTERWLGSLRGAYHLGWEKGRLLRQDLGRFRTGLRWSFHDVAQAPLVVATVALLAVGLFAPPYFFLATLLATAPAWTHLLLLKRGVDQFSPDFFFLGAPLVVARAWAVTAGAVRGLWPPRKRAANTSRSAAPQKSVPTPTAVAPPGASAKPAPAGGHKGNRYLLDPASVVQRKQSVAGDLPVPTPSDAPHKDRDEVVAEEDRELDLTP